MQGNIHGSEYLQQRIRVLEREMELLRSERERLEQGYESTFQHAGVGIAHVDAAGRILHANARFCEMIGRSPELVATLSFPEFTHPEDLSHNLDHLERLKRGELSGYRLEKRYVRPNGEVLWVDLTVSAHRDEAGRLVKLISVIVDITEQRLAAERIQFLVDELSHRTKNMIAVVRAVVGQSARHSESVEGFREALEGRLFGMAKSQDAMLSDDFDDVDLRTLVTGQAAIFAPEGEPRLFASGPDCMLKADAARAIGMALHELATNACKYGSLSAPGGIVRVEWALDCEEPCRFCLYWSESGGPIVLPPTRRGFGRDVIERFVAMSTGGSVSLVFDPNGIRWTLTAPASIVVRT